MRTGGTHSEFRCDPWGRARRVFPEGSKIHFVQTWSCCIYNQRSWRVEYSGANFLPRVMYGGQWRSKSRISGPFFIVTQLLLGFFASTLKLSQVFSFVRLSLLTMTNPNQLCDVLLLCVLRWLMRPILALNCLLQIEQERSEPESSVGDALALAFRWTRFCSASLILFASYSPAPLFMRPCHFVITCAICSHDSVGMLKSLREVLRVSLYHFFLPPWERWELEVLHRGFLWQTFIRHSDNMACPS